MNTVIFKPLDLNYPCNDPDFSKPLPFTVLDWRVTAPWCDRTYCRNLSAFADPQDGKGECPRPNRLGPVRDLNGVRPARVF